MEYIETTKVKRGNILIFDSGKSRISLCCGSVMLGVKRDNGEIMIHRFYPSTSKGFTTNVRIYRKKR